MQTQLRATPTSIKLSVELRERLQNLAKVRHRTPHSLMIQALETYIAREEQRESLRHEAMAAYNEFILTGLHVTAEEADAWFAELEAGNDVEPPKCHI